MSDTSTGLPNLYQLLGLTALEGDPATIANAIQGLLAKTKSLPPESDALQRHQKVAALAQKYLLDPQRKSAYDRQWRAVYQSNTRPDARPAKPAVVATPVAQWDYSRLNRLLPEGDPFATFNLGTFLREHESRDPRAAEADLHQLLALLGEAENGHDLDQLPTAATCAAEELEPGIRIDNRTSAEMPIQSTGIGHGERSAGNPFSKRMRRRQQRSMLIGGSLLITGVIFLVAAGLFLMNRNSPKPTESLARQEQRRPSRNPSRGSGLPKPNMGIVTPSGEPVSAPPVASGLPQPGQATEAPNIEAPNIEAAESIPVLANPAPETAAPLSSSSATTQTPLAMESAASAAPSMAEVVPTAEQKNDWRQGMDQLKSLIGEHKFEQADKLTDELKKSARTSVQRDQLQRLEQASSYVKEIRTAIVEAIAGLGPADTFTIGTSLIAAFVEGSDQRITIRVSGERRSYLIEELPVAIGLALVDRKMDSQHAATLARKGAYVMLHPKSNKLTYERGKQMLQEAEAAGAIEPEFAKFYEDDYALAKLDR